METKSQIVKFSRGPEKNVETFEQSAVYSLTKNGWWSARGLRRRASSIEAPKDLRPMDTHGVGLKVGVYRQKEDYMDVS